MGENHLKAEYCSDCSFPLLGEGGSGVRPPEGGGGQACGPPLRRARPRGAHLLQEGGRGQACEARTFCTSARDIRNDPIEDSSDCGCETSGKHCGAIRGSAGKHEIARNGESRAPNSSIAPLLQARGWKEGSLARRAPSGRSRRRKCSAWNGAEKSVSTVTFFA